MPLRSCSESLDRQQIDRLSTDAQVLTLKITEEAFGGKVVKLLLDNVRSLDTAVPRAGLAHRDIQECPPPRLFNTSCAIVAAFPPPPPPPKTPVAAPIGKELGTSAPELRSASAPVELQEVEERKKTFGELIRKGIKKGKHKWKSVGKRARKQISDLTSMISRLSSPSWKRSYFRRSPAPPYPSQPPWRIPLASEVGNFDVPKDGKDQVDHLPAENASTGPVKGERQVPLRPANREGTMPVASPNSSQAGEASVSAASTPENASTDPNSKGLAVVDQEGIKEERVRKRDLVAAYFRGISKISRPALGGLRMGESGLHQ